MFKNQDRLFDAVPLRNALQKIRDMIKNLSVDTDLEEVLEMGEKIVQMCDEALDVPLKEDLRFFGGELTTNEKLLNSFDRGVLDDDKFIDASMLSGSGQ